MSVRDALRPHGTIVAVLSAITFLIGATGCVVNANHNGANGSSVSATDDR